jgi:transcriptional regulator with XRE-family HTH domain
MSAIANARPTAIARLLDDLRQRGGLTGRDIANILGVSPPTVSRWASGESWPTIEKQRIIAELRWVAERLSDFYAPDEARLWLQSAHPQLAGARPYDLVVRGRTGEVLEVIERLDSSVYL